jgi:hypothetical protein
MQRVIGVIGVVLGGFIILDALTFWSTVRPDGFNAYLAGRLTGQIFGLVLFIVGLYTVLKIPPPKPYFRIFADELEKRRPVDDNELLSRFSEKDVTDPSVPKKVRKLLAKHTFLPANKLLPDDDLGFYWEKLPMDDFIADLEATFGIKITAADTEKADCTIWDISILVDRKLSASEKSKADPKIQG